MRDPKIKALIIAMLITIIVIIITSIMLFKKTNKQAQNMAKIRGVNIATEIENVQSDTEDITSPDLPAIEEPPVFTESDYMTIKKCITGFLNTINKNNSAYYGADGTRTSSDEEIAEKEISLLSQDFISKNNITAKNISQYVYNLKTNTFFVPTEVKKFYELNEVSSFVVKGMVEDTEYHPIMEVVLIVNLDTEQSTYSVEIIKEKNDISTVIPTQLDKIEKNDYNEFAITESTNENIIKETVNTFKQTILGYPEVCYNKFMPAEYKQAKFANANAFKTYVQRNRELIEQINIKGYQKIDGGNRTTYILVDQYQNRYILNYRSMIDYTMTLDYYTIAVDTFKNAYDSADEDVKVSTQMNKLQQMLNFKDYNAIYSKLNATFRNNNYQNVNKLAQYLDNNTYALNTIEVNNMEQRDGYYICTCTLKNQKNTQEQKNMTIMIKLNDYNNFEMSFSM